MEFAFGGPVTYMLPEEQTLTPGEAYKLRITVDGRTFTSKKAARVLDALQITTPDGQYIDPGTSFTVQWDAVDGAAGYAVDVTSLGEDKMFAVGMATQKVLSGELFGQDGSYTIGVSAYDETMAPYITQGENAVPSIYGFDDPKVLGALSSMSTEQISLWVGSGGENGGDGGGNGGDGGELGITVSGGLTPTISWTGGGAVGLTVATVGEPPSLMWGIVSTDPATGFGSPVTYGQAPSGAVEMGAAEPLVAGTTYQVIIGSMQGDGTKTFTP